MACRWLRDADEKNRPGKDRAIMRLIHLMTFVCALLLLASVPACLQFGRIAGLPQSVSMTTAGAICFLAFMAARRPS